MSPFVHVENFSIYPNFITKSLTAETKKSLPHDIHLHCYLTEFSQLPYEGGIVTLFPLKLTKRFLLTSHLGKQMSKRQVWARHAAVSIYIPRIYLQVSWGGCTPHWGPGHLEYVSLMVSKSHGQSQSQGAWKDTPLTMRLWPHQGWDVWCYQREWRKIRTQDAHLGSSTAGLNPELPELQRQSSSLTPHWFPMWLYLIDITEKASQFKATPKILLLPLLSTQSWIQLGQQTQ